MKIYKGKIDITPKMKLRLAGFAHRTRANMGVKNKLFLRALIIEENSKKIAIFTADILFWDSKIVENLKNIIERKYKIDKEYIVFSATHNHSGPLLASNMLPEIGEHNQDYIEFLETRVIELTDSIYCNPIEVYAEYIKDEMYFGINRRLKVDNEVLMKPNSQGVVDNSCSLVKFINMRSGKLESLIINYALHANVTDDNYINTDYPGIICENLESEYKGSLILYLQGFTGNIRPKLIIGEEFFRGTFDTAINFANQVSSKLVTIIEKKGRIIQPKFDSCSLKVKMPIDTSIQKNNRLFNEENNDFFIKWIDFINKHKEQEDIYLQIQGIKISNDLIMISLNGEVVTEYGLYIREKYNDIDLLTLGYSNGMIGYLATKEQLLEGGYEAEDFIYYFGLPGKYSMDIDKIIKESMIECIENLKGEVN